LINFVVNPKDHRNCRIQLLVVIFHKLKQKWQSADDDAVCKLHIEKAHKVLNLDDMSYAKQNKIMHFHHKSFLAVKKSKN